MDPITIGTGIVILVSAGVASGVKHYQNKLKKKDEDLRKLVTTLSQHAKAYQFEECDKAIIASVKDYIAQLCGEGKLSDLMANKTEMKDRKDFMIKIVREIANLMNIELSDINIVDLGPYTYGQSYIEDNKYKIDLNEVVLVSDPDRLLRTACHELRHLQQMQALKDDKWGFSDNRKAQWMMSFNYYVDSENTTELQYLAYVLQSVEIDANKFADEVTKH